MPKAPSKKNGLVGTKKKGAMEMAKAAAAKAKRIPEKTKGKICRQPESDDELKENNE